VSVFSPDLHTGAVTPQPSKRSRQVEFAKATMNRIGYGLINEKKASVRAEKRGAHVEKSDMKGSMIC
jgi:hypothetical protein